MLKRLLATSMAALLSPLAATQAQAAFPEKPVQVVVPYVAGGPTDLAARLVTTRMSQRLGQQFIVENRGGAGGNIGADYVVRSPADGYHLLIIGAAHAINKSLYKNISYDVQKDLAPVAMLTTAPMVLLANPGFKPNTVQEMVDYAKQNPGLISYASQGNGTAPHLATELLKAKTGIDLVHVPYKGSAQSLSDMASGQVQMGFDSVVVGKQFTTSGLLKALAVTGAKRSSVLLDVPTMAESGFPDVDASVWYAVVAPADTPPEVIKVLNTTINEILAEPEIRAKLNALGAEAAPMTPQEFASFLDREVTKWAEVVKLSGAQVD